jgi:hypothetical protein
VLVEIWPTMVNALVGIRFTFLKGQRGLYCTLDRE